MTKAVPIENGLQVGTLVASAISVALVVVSVGLRLLAKSLSAGFDYSDYCIVGALVRLPFFDIFFNQELRLTTVTVGEHRTSHMLHGTGHSWRLWLPHHGHLCALRP